jgi:hypothetical protein
VGIIVLSPYTNNCFSPIVVPPETYPSLCVEVAVINPDSVIAITGVAYGASGTDFFTVSG